MQKTEGIVRGVVRRGIGTICALLLLLFPFGMPVFSQDSGPTEPVESAAPAPLLTPAQLDDLVAPIALYPDALLSQVLVASTYPLEIVEASQWLQQNRNLQGQQLVDAARQQNWDPSIQALVAFPDVLGRLASNAGWTSDLGNAFLAQQADVMNAVQTMRAQAQASGKLNSDSEQTVVTQTQGGRTVIEIAPANPQVVYVPVYNPEYIWGPPVWGYYPSLYYPAVSFGFGFGPSIFVGAYFGGWTGWGAGGWGGWGWGPNWFNCTVIQNSYFFNHYGFRNYHGGGFGRGGIWAHNPYHRMGVPYPSQGLARRFGGNYASRGGVVRAGLGGQRGGAFGGSRFQSNARSSGLRGTGSANGWRRFGNPGASVNQRGGTFGGSRSQSPQVRGNARSFGTQNRAAAGGWRSFGSTNANAGFGSRMQSPVNGRSSGNRSSGFNSAAASRGNSFRSTPSYSRSYAAPRQSFQGAGRSYAAPRQSFQGAGRSYAAPRQSFQGASRSYAAPRQSFQGGSRSYAAPRQSFQGGGRSYAAPRQSFQGGGRSFGGSRPSSGGGGSRSFGGGGGFHGGGGGGSHGGGHGGRR